MADFARSRAEIEASGLGLIALATDSVTRLAAMRTELELGFPVLCDGEREVVRRWGVFDPDRGGIAIPALVVVDPSLAVRFVSVDSLSTRVSPAALLAWANGAGDRAVACGRARVRPGLGYVWRAFRFLRRP